MPIKQNSQFVFYGSVAIQVWVLGRFDEDMRTYTHRLKRG
jgi:hypothetical protein